MIFLAVVIYDLQHQFRDETSPERECDGQGKRPLDGTGAQPPEVVTFSEYVSGHRVAGIVNALICIFMKAGMALGGVVPGLVLAWVGFKAGEAVQEPMAEQGILWLVTLIPAVLFVLAIFVIGKYELSDEKMDELNAAVTNKLKIEN